MPLIAAVQMLAEPLRLRAVTPGALVAAIPRACAKASLASALAAILAVAAARAAAQQQSTSNAPPAERFLVSPGGVDMRSLRYVYSQTDLAIGGEAGALALTRSLAQPVAGHVNPFANFSHNWDILLSEKRVSIHEGRFTHETGPDYQIEIAYGGLSQTFRGSGAPGYGFDQVSRAGFGSLTYTGDRAGPNAVYTFTTGDGTVAVFRPIGSADCSTVLRCAYVAQVTEPDGTQLGFQYDVPAGPNSTRLRRVTSSRGYALLLEYSGAHVIKACVLNLALRVAPADNVCPADALATASYGYTALNGEPRLASATDAVGAASSFTYAPGSVGFVRAGETTPWLTNGVFYHGDDEGLLTEHVGSQAFGDGSSYVYGIDQPPPVPTQVTPIVGSGWIDGEGHEVQLRYRFPPLPRPGQGGGNVPGDDDDPQPETYQMTPGPEEIVDELGRTTTVNYCDANPFLAVRTTYDPAGRPIKVETGRLTAWQSEAVAPANWGASFSVDRTLETAYDVMGRKTRDSLREGHVGPVRTVTQYSYDALGRPECTAVRMNPAAFGALPASACTLGPAGSNGPDRIVRNVYDAAGQRLQLREGVGSADEGAEATWAYNLNGQMTTVIDGNGNRAELGYDGHGRQERWTFPSTTRPTAFNDATPATAIASAGSVNPDDYEGYSYDPNGNRTNLRKRDGRNIFYAYDALSRVTSKT